jgi:predicted small secreted protein
MKCVQNNDTKKIERVTNIRASRMVLKGGWTYVAKELWKRDVRDVNVNHKNKEAK